MMERRFVVQYRVKTWFGFKWVHFTDFILEADAVEKAKKLSKLGVTRVVPVWYE